MNTYIVIVNNKVYKYDARTIKELENQLDRDFAGEEVLFSHIDNFSKFNSKA